MKLSATSTAVLPTSPRFGTLMPDGDSLPGDVNRKLAEQADHKCYKSLEKHGYDVRVTGVKPIGGSQPTRIRVELYKLGKAVPGAVGEIPVTAKHLLRKIATTALSLGILHTNSEADSLPNPPDTASTMPAAPLVRVTSGKPQTPTTPEEGAMFTPTITLNLLGGPGKRPGKP